MAKVTSTEPCPACAAAGKKANLEVDLGTMEFNCSAGHVYTSLENLTAKRMKALSAEPAVATAPVAEAAPPVPVVEAIDPPPVAIGPDDFFTGKPATPPAAAPGPGDLGEDFADTPAPPPAPAPAAELTKPVPLVRRPIPMALLPTAKVVKHPGGDVSYLIRIPESNVTNLESVAATFQVSALEYLEAQVNMAMDNGWLW